MIESLKEHIGKRNIGRSMKNAITSYLEVDPELIPDPVLLLLLESLSEEMFRVSEHISDMESRIQDKLSSTLVPGLEGMARPPHAVIGVYPTEDSLVVTKQTAFSFRGNAGDSFYPVCDAILRKGSIQYMVHNGMLYSLNDSRLRVPLCRGRKSFAMDTSALWMALRFDNEETDLKGISFYLDFPHGQYGNDFLKLLPYSIWKVKGEVLTLSRGISAINLEETGDATLDLFARYHPSDLVNSSVKQEYDPHFLTIDTHCEIKGKQELLPASLHECFDGRLPEEIKDPLVWIEVTFPREISAEAISSVQISLNVLPVVCKKQVYKTFRLNPNLPVVPLDTGNGESFLGIHSLTDSEGKEYYEMPVASGGIYALRRGGCERFGKREARQRIVELLAAMRKEAAALVGEKAGKKNSLTKVHRDIEAIINKIQAKINLSEERLETKNYLFLPPDAKREHLYFLRYWVTGKLSDERIMLGSRLSGQAGSAKIVSPISEYCATPEQSEKYAAYKKSIESPPLLATDKDIREFCLREFPELVSDVKITWGFKALDGADPAFIRTIDVKIMPHRDMKGYISENDLCFIGDYLKQNSPFTFNYRIFVDGERRKVTNNIN